MVEAKTLQSALLQLRDVEDKGIKIVFGSDNEKFISYKNLYDDALLILGALQKKGLKKGDYLILQADNNDTFLILFWACVLGGAVPIPIEMGRSEVNKEKLKNVIKTIDTTYLVVENETTYKILEWLESDGIERDNARWLSYEDLEEKKTPGVLNEVGTQDLAFIQFSSGSTDNPKGVVLKNENIVTNIYDIINGVQPSPEDVMVGWIPLTHDMGLIGMHLCVLFLGANMVNIPTPVFIRNPILWINELSRNKATTTQSPNFGLRYVLGALKPDVEYDWDLSHLRIIFNGAEPISVESCKDFQAFFGEFGLKSTTMFTVYGMAEAGLAITFPIAEKDFSYLTINRDYTKIGESIQEVKGQSENAFEVVSVGKPIGEMRIKICDDSGKQLPDNQIGEIFVAGKNVTSGYLGIDSSSFFDSEGFIKSGDLGFIRNGNLYVTGRKKELIIVGGQNYYPHDIENRISKILKIPEGRVVAGSTRGNQGEYTLVFVQFRKKIEDFLDTADQIKEILALLTGDMNAVVLPVKRIPKTTSGKIQRGVLVKSYNEGEFTEAECYLTENFNGKKLDWSQDKLTIRKNLIIFLSEEINALDNVSDVGIDIPLMDLGITSRQMLFLQAKLSFYCNEKIEIVTFFNYPTIEKITDFLVKEYKKKINDNPEQDKLANEISEMTDEDIIRMLENDM